MDENRYTFKEQCFLYGRCYRGEFLKQILKQFIALANESELDSIKKAVASRKKSIRMGGAAGRPSVENEQEWFRRTVEQARQRFVVRMGWKDIAIKARMRDTPGKRAPASTVALQAR